jgi:predicted dehydrogenase
MEKISAAIIGLGRIASLLEDDPLREKPCTHAGAITANNDCVLVAGCDIDEARQNLFTKKWNVPVYTDAGEMLRIHHPQILVIATHPDSHLEYCRLAATRHIPVVICEKPLADSLRKAHAIAQLCAGSNSIKIITNHERRYSEDYISAKAVLDEGCLGKLLGIRGTLYMGRGRRLLDVLWHDGTHLVDAIMFLTGATLKCRRSWGTRLTGKKGTAYLEGEVRNLAFGAKDDAVPVLIELGAGRDHLVFEMEFSCERGRLRIGNGIYEIWQSEESPYAKGFRSLKNTGVKFEGATGYFANMVKDAVACVRNAERQPRSSAADGLQVIKYLNSVKGWG